MPKQVLSSSQLGRPLGVYSQATKAPASGHLIFVSGLVARAADGTTVGRGDIRAQTRFILESLKTILAEGGASLADVTKVTVFIRDMADFDAIHEVRREYFPQDPPASSMVQVTSLVSPDYLIEIEAIAVAP
jgi:reactive intermediate/imine deaminase